MGGSENWWKRCVNESSDIGGKRNAGKRDGSRFERERRI